MNTEDKQIAMLIDDLSAYIKDKHTQEECIGFIDGYNAALTKLKILGTPDVVGQSEQLQSILTDLDNKEITKHQAYDLILVLFDVVEQSE